MDPGLPLNSNFTYNQNSTVLDTFDAFKIFCGVMLYVIFILSTIGNGLLLHALFCYKDVKNVTHMYFLHLACSDLALTLTLPFAATTLIARWVFGEFACKLSRSVFYCGMTSTIILLTAISLDQFSTVVIQKGCVIPVKRRRCAIGACTVAWMVSLAVGVPCFTYSEVVNVGDKPICRSNHIPIYFAVLSIFLFALIVFCYSAILWTALRALTKKKLRTALLTLYSSVAYFVCWAPHTILVIASFNNFDLNQEIVYYVALLLTLSHCCINPMIYMMSPKFRKHVLSVFCCEKVCTKRQK